MTATELNNEKTNTCLRELSIEIPADVVTGETENLLQKYRKLARIPGFRPGKAPASVVKKRFDQDIRAEAVENLIPKYFRQEAEKRNLTPVSQPRVADLHFADGEPLRFKASFEVMPEIDIAGYQDIHVERSSVSVSQDEVDQQLETIREQQSTYTNVEEDRKLKDGDFAQVSFRGSVKARKRRCRTKEQTLQSQSRWMKCW